MEINGYQLSRSWFDFCFDNPELINPNHTAIFMFAIEHCNRLGWKEKFGFPSQMTMDALGIKNHHTYIKYFNDLVSWGFFKLIQKSTNQYSANVISLSFGKSKNSKALDKAFIKHTTKQQQSNPQSTQQSNDSINKQQTINQLNKEPINNITANAEVFVWPTFLDFWNKYDKKVGKPKSEILWKKIEQGAREKIMEHLDRYGQIEKKYRKDPERYLKNECWNDEIVNQEKDVRKSDKTNTGEFKSFGGVDYSAKL